MSSQSFADLGVSRPVLGALSERGIHEPFAVQRLCISDVLDGRDVLVQSPTGSGKTLAFGVPLVELTAAEARRPAALILAPTRELAEQIVDELDSIAHSRALSVAAVYGGVGIAAQVKRAARAHIVVATPGRLEDLLQRRDITLEHVRTLVLDEADRMLDMGFKPPVDRIVAKLPSDRQTLFFSATLEGEAGRLAGRYTRNAVTHTHAPKVEKPDITHRFVHVSHEGKVDALVTELRDAERGRTLVFVRTKRGADRLVKKLSRNEIHAIAMHGNKSQNQRRRALAAFENGSQDTLVATDVAARGIDVPEITHVINFDAPEDRDTYVHRTGRTARAGAAGIAASFVVPDQRRDMSKIAHQLGLREEFDGATHVAGRPHVSGGGGSHPDRSNGASHKNGSKPRGGNRGRGRNGAKPGGHGGSGSGPKTATGTTKSYRPPRNRRRRAAR